MHASRIRAAGLAVAASLGLSACASYGGFGQSGVSVGVGSGGYYDPYNRGYGYDRYGQRYGGYGGYGGGYGGYSPYGYGYSPYGYAGRYPWGGWHNGYYYPGSGRYVYRDGRRLKWTPAQRGHFEELRRVWRERALREREGDSDEAGQQSRVVKSVSGAREVRRPSGQVRRQVRTEAPRERRAARAEVRQERRARAVEAWRERRQSSSGRSAIPRPRTQEE